MTLNSLQAVNLRKRGLDPLKTSPVTLAGCLVRLEPLRESHVAALNVAAAEASIWTWMPCAPVLTEPAMRQHVADAQEREALGLELPFAVVHQSNDQAIGSTRYLDLRPEHRGLEIGSTWYALQHHRTGVNAECKLLLLTHAFETLECVRVQLKTDLRNLRSQQAIERLGVSREGILRNHMILPNGYVRSTVMYSITNDQWPAVKRGLVDRLAARGRSS